MQLVNGGINALENLEMTNTVDQQKITDLSNLITSEPTLIYYRHATGL